MTPNLLVLGGVTDRSLIYLHRIRVMSLVVDSTALPPQTPFLVSRKASTTGDRANHLGAPQPFPNPKYHPSNGEDPALLHPKVKQVSLIKKKTGQSVVNSRQVQEQMKDPNMEVSGAEAIWALPKIPRLQPEVTVTGEAPHAHGRQPETAPPVSLSINQLSWDTVLNYLDRQRIALPRRHRS